nr:NAD-binding protein [Halomonas sp. MCCC 1A13316]
MRESLLGGLAQSKVLDVHGERMISRSFDPGFKVRLHQKGLNLALDGARSLNLALPTPRSYSRPVPPTAAPTGTMPASYGPLEKLADHEMV